MTLLPLRAVALAEELSRVRRLGLRSVVRLLEHADRPVGALGLALQTLAHVDALVGRRSFRVDDNVLGIPLRRHPDCLRRSLQAVPYVRTETERCDSSFDGHKGAPFW